MNTKKNLLATIIFLASATLGSFGYAAWTDNVLPIQNIPTVASCADIGKMYLNQDNDSDGKADYYLYLNSNFILNGSTNNFTAGQILGNAGGVTYTQVNYYTPLANMLYKVDGNNVVGALDNNTFWRASRVFPYNTPLRGIATTPNKVVFERPSDNDPNKNIVSVVYNYQYKYAIGFDGSANSSYRYNQVPNMGYMDNIGLTYITTLPGSDGNRKRSRSAIQNTSNCKNYELHRCGNGIVENSSNGYLNQFTAEQCDGTAGVPAGYTCTNTCTLQEIVAKPTCTLSVSSGSIIIGNAVQTSWTINGNYTNTPQITYTPTTWNITGLPYTVANAMGQQTITPTHTGAYMLSMTVSNSAGSSVCTAPLTVLPPQSHLQCTLSINPNPVSPNQFVSIGWNITGGTFQTTYIMVFPQGVRVGGAWPHQVPTNTYSGTSTVQPIQTGDYTFSMNVQGMPRGGSTMETVACTGILHVTQTPLSTCSLTTNTPTIQPGQTAILNASYTNAILATMTPNITGLNFLFPNRSNSNIAVNPTTTTTYILHTLGTSGSGATCSTTINVINTSLTLNKTLISNILYHSGDLVSFKIDFANNGLSTANGVVLSDYLPAGLEYVSSQIYGVAPYTSALGINGVNQFVEYSGFSLTPGQSGYLIVVGKFKGYAYANQTLNNSFLKSDTTPMLYSAALFNVYMPNGNASVVKTSDKLSYSPGEDAKFTLAVTNNGPDAIDHVTITDDRPNTAYLLADTQWTSNVPLTMTNNTDPYVWTYNGSLAVGQTIYLYITGHISNTPASVGTYVNTTLLSYMVNGQIKTGQANATINVLPTSVSTMIFEKRLIQYGNNVGDTVKFELLYQNNGTATITHYDIVDYWPGTLHFVSASPMPITQTPTSGGMVLHWIFTTPLAPNGSGKITLNGTIK